MTTASDAAPSPPPHPNDVRARPVASRLLTGLGWRAGSTVISVIGGFVGTMLAARVVDTTDFATYIVAISAFIIAPPLVQLGIAGNTVRRVSELCARGMTEQAFAYGRKALTIITLVGPVGSFGVAGLVLITHPSHPVSVFAALGLALWLEALRLGASYILLAHERQAWAAVTSYSSRTGVTAVILAGLFAANVHTSLAFVLWLIVIVQAVLAVIGLIAVEPNIATTAKGPQTWPMITDGLPAMVVDGGNYILARGDVWAAAAVFVSHTDSASYGAASTLAAQLALPAAFSGVIVSPIVRSLWIERRTRELDAMLRTVATATTAVCALGAVILISVAGPLLRIVYLPTFERAAPAMAILAVGSVAAVVSGLSGESLVMCVSLRLAAVVHGAWAVGAVALLWLGARYGGLVGLAAASSGVTAGISATQVLIVWRRTGIVTLPAVRVRSRAAALREPRAWTPT